MKNVSLLMNMNIKHELDHGGWLNGRQYTSKIKQNTSVKNGEPKQHLKLRLMSTFKRYYFWGSLQHYN